MTEDTWRMFQLFMWVIGTQTLVLISVLGGIWFSIGKKFESLDSKFMSVDVRFNSIASGLKEIRTSLNRMEGAFYSKDNVL